MKTLADLSPVALRMRLQAIDQQIELIASDLLEEKRLLEKFLKAKTVGKQQLYADFQNPSSRYSVLSGHALRFQIISSLEHQYPVEGRVCRTQS